LWISFEAVSSQVFSVVAAQSRGALAPYHAGGGYEIPLVKPGVLSAAALVAERNEDKPLRLWLLRGVGFILLAVGFALCVPVANQIPLFQRGR
jgi:hypothetical protein